MTTYLVVQQVVRDIPAWYEQFSAASPMRQRAGGGDPLVLVEDGEAGAVLVIIPFSSAEAATAWRSRVGVQQQTAASGVEPESILVRVLQSVEPVSAEG